MKKNYKLFALIILSIFSTKINSTFGQATQAVNAIAGGDYLGSSNAVDVNFKGAGNQYMVLKQATGRFGIGTTGPNELLEVNGNVRIGTSNAFMIAGNKVLWHNNSPTNIYVGVGAGAAVSTGTDNVFAGSSAGTATTWGRQNVFLGSNAGFNNTHSSDNVAVGYSALYTQSKTDTRQWPTYNIAVGSFALYTNNPTNSINAVSNIALGWESLHKNTIGSYNTAIGFQACSSNTDANHNIAIGYRALYKQDYANGSLWTSGNIAIGNNALYENDPSSNSDGIQNIGLGNFSGNSNTTGKGNILIGESAGYFNSTGNNNAIVGFEAGKGATGSNSSNAFLGYRAGYGSTTGSFNVFIGSESGFTNTTGGGNPGAGATPNTFVGYKSGYGNTSGGDNVAIGSQAGFTGTIATKNVFIGNNAGYSNTTAGENVAIGYEALKNQAHNNGGAVWVSYNTAVGYKALTTNVPGATTTGVHNSALGHNALLSNTTGYSNTANGSQALTQNNTGYNNTASGNHALSNNTTGYNNTATGFTAGVSITSAAYNTLSGFKALYYSTTGGENTATGANALINTTASYNTAVGVNAGTIITSGTYNTFLGHSADVAAACSTLSNMTAIGRGAVANAANSIRLGNATVTVIEGYPASYTQVSDGRFKFNVSENVRGLEFIKKLRPVLYQMNTKQFDDFLIQGMPDSIKTKHQDGMDFAPSTATVHSGFIAQEVEQAANEIGYDFDGVHKPQHVNGNYSLAYSQFVVPLVKGMQEQQKMIDSLMTMVSILQGGGHQKKMGGGSDDQGNSNKEITNSIELANNSEPILYQNEPNPFDGSTIIRYFIPENVTGSASVAFYDMYGKEVNKLELKERGFGKIEANTENLAVGIYSYSIIINGKSIDTKKMLKSR